MILGWPSQILHVATEGAGGDGAQPIRMIEKAEIFFNLNVTHIMPVADVWGRDFFEQPGHFALRWNLFVAAASFDAETDISGGGVGCDRLQTFLDPAQRHSSMFFPPSHGSDFFANVRRENNSPFSAKAINSSVIAFIATDPR